MPRALLSLALASVFAGACASGPRVPVSGSPGDLSALAGEWHGEYHADKAGGRSGTIYFRLTAGVDTATGDVLMHVGGRELAEALPVRGDPWATASHHQLLRITFVRTTGGTVFGRLDPYPDPICGCELRTTFTGRRSGDVIEGSYTSTHLDGGDSDTGKWRVTRRPGP